MKKLGILFAAVCCVFGLASCTKSEDKKAEEQAATTTLDIAMVTDYGDITDQSFNQATYEGCKDWAKENGAHFAYYKPASNSDDDRVNSILNAIGNGANTIVMPGYAFAPAIDTVLFSTEYKDIVKDVKFIALDVSQGDLLAAHHSDWYTVSEAQQAAYTAAYTLPSNLYCAVYKEELCGYFAGYAAVCEGYTKLGFLGGMSVPAVIRYGHGFVQGCEAAAADKGITGVSVNYVYGGQFFGDAAITAVMDTWYGNGTEVVFACGGGIYTSACEAAKKVHGKVIGVDVDQSGTINVAYEDGMCITSAMKGLYATVQTQLSNLTAGQFVSKIETLGLVSGTEVDKNYVQLPTATWSMKNFTKENYVTLVGQVKDGTKVVSDSTSEHPTVSHITVNYAANIH